MKLSEIQKLKADILALDMYPTEYAFSNFEESLNPISFGDFNKSDVLTSSRIVKDGFKQLKMNIEASVIEIDRTISKLYEQYLIESNKENEFHLRATVEENRALRLLPIRAETEETILSRLGGYLSWQHPGLEIGPGDGVWTSKLVALDPLYVIDVHEEFLNNTKSQFSPEYQARLRTYLVPDCDYSALPKKQLGFVFAWNVFNYFSLEHIEQVLANLKPLLKPGAVLFFSYNNCDRYKCTELFERHSMTFVPNSRLVPILHNLGYEVIRSMDLETHVSWIEIKLNGHLESNRSGQTLGKIIHSTS